MHIYKPALTSKSQHPASISLHQTRPANKFSKSQINKFSLISGPSAKVAICGFAIVDPFFLATCGPNCFSDFKLLKVRKYITYIFKNNNLKCSNSNLYKKKI